MTLVVVLMFGLGGVLIASAVETDPKTGKSVSITQTISDIWNDKVDFSQPGGAASNGGGAGGQFVYVPPSPNTTTLATASYQNAAVASYLQTRTM